jgi:hypothetical protein
MVCNLFAHAGSLNGLSRKAGSLQRTVSQGFGQVFLKKVRNLLNILAEFGIITIAIEMAV